MAKKTTNTTPATAPVSAEPPTDTTPATVPVSGDPPADTTPVTAPVSEDPSADTMPVTAPVSEEPPALVDIGALCEKHKVDRATFAGVCAMQGWNPGKAVTEDAFLSAVQQFRGAPMSAPAIQKEGKK